MLNSIRRRLGMPAESRSGLRERRPDDVRILALTSDASNWRDLQDIADRERWPLLWARSSHDARELMLRTPVLIIICDRDLPNEDWREAVAALAAVRPRACILLASETSDEYLWREVVQHGGFEVLTKPFQPDRVTRMIRFASNWRGWAIAATPATDSGHNAFADRVKD